MSNQRPEDLRPITKSGGYKDAWKPKTPPALAVGICPKCGGPRRKARCWDCYINGRLLRGKEVPESAQEKLAEKRRKQLEKNRKKAETKRLKRIRRITQHAGKDRMVPGMELRRIRVEQLCWAIEMLNYFTGCFEVVDDGRYVVYEDVTNSAIFNDKMREVKTNIAPLLKLSRKREERKKEIIAASKELAEEERNWNKSTAAKAREARKRKEREKQQEGWAF